MSDDSPTYAFADGELEQLKNIKSLYLAGDGEGCVFRLKRLASDRKFSALNMLGLIYETGCGPVDGDLKTAIDWYHRSIEAIDDIESHRGLARVYLQANSLDPGHQLARYHLDLLVENEYMGGYYGLGIMYQHGIGVQVDNQVAASHFKNAMDRGHLMAEVGLREVSDNGRLRNLISALSTAWRIARFPKLSDDNSALII